MERNIQTTLYSHTKYQTTMVNQRIFVKRTETSRKEIVTNFDDIASLECRSHRQSMRNSQDCPPVLARSPEHPRPETESVI